MLKVYGCSDDLVEIDGEIRDEYDAYGTDEEEKGVLLVMSDNTILEVKYGKLDKGIWGIQVHAQGSLFDHIDYCMDDETDPYSDVAHFKDGIKWVVAAKDWQFMK